MSLLAALSQDRHEDAAVITDSVSDYTAAEVLTRCDRLQRMLAQHAIHSLALHAHNGIDWVVSDLVCQHHNHILLPLPTFFSNEQISFALTNCNVDALLTNDPDNLQCLAGMEWENLGLLPESNLQLILMTGAKSIKAVPAGTGKITFTSGSTGQPKGVCLSHAQLQLQAEVLRDCVGLECPRHLCVLPLSTLLENIAGVYAPLLAGGHIIVPDQIDLGFKGSALVDSQKLLSAISCQQPHSLILVPELLLLLITAASNGWQPPKSLKFIAVGGSKVGADLLAAAARLGLPIFEGYGLSECGSVVSLNTSAANRIGSCGKALPHLQLSFADGEVAVKGNSMLGYLGEPTSWNQPVIKTGDIGHLDADGFLHIDGRCKNLLISSFGRNISPEWVESELLANPLLAEAIVIGDARPYCVALLSLRDAMEADDLEAWIEQVNANLPDYARIERWLVVTTAMAQQPGLYTENGKPKRQAIDKVFAKEIEQLYHLKAVA